MCQKVVFVSAVSDGGSSFVTLNKQFPLFIELLESMWRKVFTVDRFWASCRGVAVNAFASNNARLLKSLGEVLLVHFGVAGSYRLSNGDQGPRYRSGCRTVATGRGCTSS